MQQTKPLYHEASILTRLEWPHSHVISPAFAKGIQTLGFSKADKDRMHTLSAKARAGACTPDEQAEIEAYSRIGSLLGILKSKARQVLKRKSANGKAKSC